VKLTGAGAASPLRSRSTSVPATRSPSRWLSLVSRMNTIAKKPLAMAKSTRPSRARMAAWRNRMGAPSLVTTRSPRAALPRVRPRHSVSKAMK